MRKKLSLLVSLLLALLPAMAPQPALAVTNYTVTVVASGGSSENTNWTYANGEITPSASVSINASDIVGKLALGPLVVNGDKIAVNASIIHSTANKLTFISTGNIIVDGGLSIQSQGGDIVFHGDSDANNTGHVRFGSQTNCNLGNVTANGGNITIGGGTNPLTGVAAAQNNDLVASCASGSPRAGVGIYNFAFNAGGGNISIRGGSPNLTSSVSTRAINISGYSGITPSFQTSGAGTISMYGDGSSISHDNAWGLTVNSPISIVTAAGDITLEGRGNPSGPTNARGVALGNTSTISSTSGNITIIDRTNGALSGYSGIYIGAALTATTGGNFSLQADEISQSGALNLDVNQASIGAFTTSSFTAVYSTGVINAANSNSLSIGSPGNTAAITLAGAVSSGGPITFTAASVTVNAAVTASNAPVTFVTSAGVTQNPNATITATSMNLAGTATYNAQAYTVTGGSTLTPPDISLSSATEKATVGWSILGYSISNAGGAATSYSISPAVGNGLHFNTNTGALTGIPVVAVDSVTYTITATNGAGSDTATFTLTILSAPLRPIISFGAKPLVQAGGPGVTLQGKNLDEIISVKIGGQLAKVTKNAAGDFVLEVPAGLVGLPDLEVVHAGGTLLMQGLIKVVAPYTEKRTVEVSGFKAGKLTSSSLAAIQASYLKGVPANIVTCSATVASDATAAEIKVATSRAKAACQAMTEFSSYINTVNVQVNASAAAGSKPTLSVTFDKTVTGK